MQHPKLQSEQRLQRLMAQFTVDRLANRTEEAFTSGIDRFLALNDYRMEGLDDPVNQRDLSIQFTWGHNHDFGPFHLQGAMEDRHIRHLAQFIEHFKALPWDLSGKKVLDIGCWTGGASLLLSAMGAEVLAIDEVKKYTDCVNYLAESFGLTSLQAKAMSLYDLNSPEFQDRFDYVLMAGVLYHVTDPLIALRNTFNCLVDGGSCLIESTGYQHDEAVISYQRRRWNWFDFSPVALGQILQDAGYRDIQVGKVTHDRRLYAVAQRNHHVEIRRDGLSQKAIR